MESSAFPCPGGGFAPGRLGSGAGSSGPRVVGTWVGVGLDCVGLGEVSLGLTDDDGAEAALLDPPGAGVPEQPARPVRARTAMRGRTPVGGRTPVRGLTRRERMESPWLLPFYAGAAMLSGCLIPAHTSSRDSPRTSAIAAMVWNAGVATRPDSIFRSVSG